MFEFLKKFIFLKRRSVVCPVIDVISDRNFEYKTGSDLIWGGFNWRLNFRLVDADC